MVELDTNKVNLKNEISSKMLLGTCDIVFPQLKPIQFQKVEKDKIKVQKMLALTSILFKIFEKDIYEQILEYRGQFLDIIKVLVQKHCQMVMLEMWKKPSMNLLIPK